MGNRTEDEGVICLDRIKEGGNELIVYNDDVHTFDYVIDCLMQICELSQQQAVTCTNIIHYKGLCVVKHGSYDKLIKMSVALDEKELKNEVR